MWLAPLFLLGGGIWMIYTGTKDGGGAIWVVLGIIAVILGVSGLPLVCVGL